LRIACGSVGFLKGATRITNASGEGVERFLL
jgi:hypothetical protein